MALTCPHAIFKVKRAHQHSRLVQGEAAQAGRIRRSFSSWSWQLGLTLPENGGAVMLGICQISHETHWH